MGLFVSKWISGAMVLDQRVLAGRILNAEVAKVDAQTKEQVVGKFAMGECDGQKNVSKTSIMTSMITVKHEVSPDQIYMGVTSFYRYTMLLLKAYLVKMHDMSGWPKTGNKLLTIVEANIQLTFDKFGVIVIACAPMMAQMARKCASLSEPSINGLLPSFAGLIKSIWWWAISLHSK